MHGGVSVASGRRLDDTNILLTASAGWQSCCIRLPSNGARLIGLRADDRTFDRRNPVAILRSGGEVGVSQGRAGDPGSHGGGGLIARTDSPVEIEGYARRGLTPRERDTPNAR